MDENIIQFVPRPNPERDAKALELKNVALVGALVHDAMRLPPRVVPDDPSEYAMDDDTAPAEYVAPDQDSA